VITPAFAGKAALPRATLAQEAQKRLPLRRANIAQLVGGSFEDLPIFGPDDHRRPSRENFNWASSFYAAFAPGRLRASEGIEVAFSGDGAEPAAAGAEDLDLDRRGAGGVVLTFQFAGSIDEVEG